MLNKCFGKGLSHMLQAVLFILLAIVCEGHGLPALAEDVVSSPQNAMVTESDNSYVQDELIWLKELGHTLQVLNKDSLLAIGELGRRIPVTVLSPNLASPVGISPVTVPAIPPPTGQILGGLAPLNKRLFNTIIVDMNGLLRQTKGQIETLAQKSNSWKQFSQSQQIVLLTNDAVQHYNKLLSLRATPESNRISMDRETVAIYDDTLQARGIAKSLYASTKSEHLKQRASRMLVQK